MKTINLTAENLKTLQSLMQQFNEIDGNEEKSLELEDFHDLAAIGRDLISILESAVNEKL